MEGDGEAAHRRKERERRGCESKSSDREQRRLGRRQPVNRHCAFSGRKPGCTFCAIRGGRTEEGDGQERVGESYVSVNLCDGDVHEFTQKETSHSNSKGRKEVVQSSFVFDDDDEEDDDDEGEEDTA